MSEQQQNAAQQLQSLENEAWSRDAKLYSTPLINGFPWYTVEGQEEEVQELSPLPHYPARRHVVPYEYTFKVFVKGRWVGKDLLSVYKTELAHHSPAYYDQCLANGRLRCVKKQSRMDLSEDGKNAFDRHNLQRREMKRNTSILAESGPSMDDPVNPILCDGDTVLHTIHRHEVPVFIGETGADPIRLLRAPIRAYGILVVDKPTGLPTHPTGRYHYNSLTGMVEYCLAPKRIRRWLYDKDALLQSVVDTSALSQEEVRQLYDYYKGTSANEEEIDLENTLRPCYRLDKATSGVLLLGVSQAATSRISAALMKKTLQMEEMTRRCLEDSNDTERYNTLISTLLHSSSGVQKSYLVRVHGLLGAGAVPVGERTLCGESAVAPPLSLSSEESDAIFGKYNLATFTEKEVPNASQIGTGTVLLSAPIELTQSSKNQQGKVDTQAAVTVCQFLHQVTSDNTVQSVGICVPFTGRRNQIRLHLRDYGKPIEHDPLGVKSIPQKEEAALRKLFFHPANLPIGYREQVYTDEAQRFYRGDSTKEPICYECAGKLPEATLSGSEGTSAICLHAYEYRIDESVLLGSEKRARSEGEEGDPASGVTVVFTAPPPSWAVL
ncbi:tRNA pseudouridine synthase 9 [Angomonas deanei]|nr:tRNA pseudouridine synthase 9 [Angomonas deanei]|eukprot:EPY38114.1 tRNA pseudouridine synthase 9 [Angomonas deanei]